MLSWKHISPLFLNQFLIFFFVILFYNQISLIFISKCRSPVIRLRRINLNHAVTIIAGSAYFLMVFDYLKDHSKELSTLENSLVVTLLLTLVSGLLAFIIYLVYLLNPAGFLPKSEVFSYYKEKELQLSQKAKEDTVSRIDVANRLLDLTIPGNIYQIFKEPFPGLEYEVQRNSVVFKYVISYDREHQLVFLRDSFHTKYGDGEYLHVYAFVDGDWKHLFDDNERPRDKKTKAFFRTLYDLKTIEAGTLMQVLKDFAIHETKLRDELMISPTSETVFPLGIIWYYVVMVMAGAKIDYFIPVGIMAKTVIFLLAVFRFFIMGAFIVAIIALLKSPGHVY